MYKFLVKTEDLLEGVERAFISIAIVMFFVTTLFSFIYLYYEKTREIAMITMDVFLWSIAGFVMSIFMQKIISSFLEKYISNSSIKGKVKEK